MSKKKRIYLLFFILLLLLIISLLLGNKFLVTENKTFEKFCSNLLKEELKQDTLSLHYTLKNPENYGIEQTQVSLPLYSEKDYAQLPILLENYIATLDHIDPEKLNDKNASCYTLLYDYIRSKQEGIGFEYYEEPFSPNSGMQSQLPILLSEYHFYKIEDVDNYLTLLSQIKPYYESLIIFEKKRVELGFCMSDSSLNKVILQCSQIMNDQTLAQGTHFLITTFNDRISELVSANLLTESEADEYKNQNISLLTGTVKDAYNLLLKEMAGLRGKSVNENGLYYYDRGKDYYEYLLKKQTGSSRSVADIKLMLTEQYKADSEALNQITLTLLKEDGLATFSPDSYFDYGSEASILNTLQSQMLYDYPSLKELLLCGDSAFNVPDVSVKQADVNLCEYLSPAFYLTPPVDDISKNVIYINPLNHLEGLDLYTTLAHEGYPGHLYQTVYTLLYQDQQNVPMIQRILYYGGFSEGWAYYVENNAYKFASQSIAKEKQDSLITNYIEACRLDRNLQICLYSLLDICIHYEGFTFEKVSKLLNDFGFQDEAVMRNIYEYIVEEPTTYLKYYVGYLEFLDCKEYAKELWKSEYSDYNFHKLILETGPCNFDYLRSLIEKECSHLEITTEKNVSISFNIRESTYLPISAFFTYFFSSLLIEPLILFASS